MGAVDQWVDSTDVLGHAERVRRLVAWYTDDERPAQWLRKLKGQLGAHEG